MRTPQDAVIHQMDLEQARREFALEMAMEHEIACLEAGYTDSAADEIVDAAQEFYDFLCGDEDLVEDIVVVAAPAAPIAYIGFDGWNDVLNNMSAEDLRRWAL